MKYKYIGKIVSTHGIKGEMKIISKSQYKDKLFKKDSFIYLGDAKEKHLIKSYRVHKIYDMITIDDLNNINDILKFVGLKVYKNRNDIHLNDNEFFYDDLINYSVIYDNKNIGTITDYDDKTSNIVFKVGGYKNFYLPFNGPFIKKINHDKSEIIVTDIGGLL